MSSHALLPLTPTGIFPAWIPAAEFAPSTPRVVLATDGEAVFTAIYEIFPDWPSGTPPEWFNATTEESFDAVITAWMECPLPPDH